MLAAVPDLDVIVVPIGGGGLISGIAIAAKAIKPDIRIVGVEAQLYPSMYNATRGTELPMRGDTLAEGIAVKSPGKFTTPLVRQYVDDIVLVSEPQLERACHLLIGIEKTVVEGARGCGHCCPDRCASTLCGQEGRPRFVRRQYRYAAAGQCASA